MTTPRRIAVLLTAPLLVLATACGGDDSSSPTSLEPMPTASAQPTDAPTSSSTSTDAPATSTPTTAAPITEAPTTPSTEPSTTAATAPPTSAAPVTEPPTTTPAGTDPEPAHSTPDPSQPFEITSDVAGGQPVGGVRSYLVEVGTTVVITLTSDTADEAHLHGYELEASLEPGVPTTMSFTATQAGSFELELHESGALLLYLDVA